MNVVIVADIFGKTPALVDFANALGCFVIIDPYHATELDFATESEAYCYFSEQVGLECYMQIISQQLQQMTASTVIAFSVGATAIWRLSETSIAKKVNNAICFYGSQIRNDTDINPLFPVELLFPIHEDHFDVDKLQRILALKNNVTCTQLPYLHGFMNPHSMNYNEIAYQQQLAKYTINSTAIS